LAHSAKGGWRRVIDSHRESPQDFCEPAEAPLVKTDSYVVHARSVVLLMADVPEGEATE
jgi:hypothetical protein